MRTLLLLLVSLLLSSTVLGRPAVRDIRDTKQFDSLLAKHKEETGLPIILDFYSDGCGPCRQIAPVYKKLAKEYAGRAVFAKVDVNKQHQISSKYGVRSMPTFVFIVDGKKVNEFSGAGEAQLRQFTKQAVDRAESNNVKLTLQSLTEFYGVNDAMKDDAAVEGVFDKCVSASKNKKGECVGGAASEMVRKLKKKYGGKAPKTERRFEKVAEDESEPAKEKKKPPKPSAKDASAPNLHLASKEELSLELEKRLEKEREAAGEHCGKCGPERSAPERRKP